MNIKTIRDDNHKVKNFVAVIENITDCITIENIFNKKDHLYSLLFHQAPLLLALSSIETGNYIEVNQEFTEKTGYTKDEIIGKTSGDLGIISDEDRKHLINHIKTQGEIRSTEAKLFKKDGSYIYCLYSGCQTNIAGKKYLLSIAQDVTQRKYAETELKKNTDFFEQLYLQSATSTQLLDAEGWCIRINPKLSELFDVQPEDIEGKKYNIFQDKEIIGTGVIHKLKKVFEEKEAATWEVKLDGKYASETAGSKLSETGSKWFHNKAYPILNDEGELESVIIQHEDITKRKQAERDLINARFFSENLIQTANVIVVALDIKGNLVIFNSTAEQITGYKREEIEGQNWFETLVPKNKYPKVWRMFNRLLNSKLPRHFENPILTKHGEEKIIRWSNNEIVQDGKVVGTISFGIDTTEQKRYETELKLAKEKAEESDRLKTEFLNNMSHEIRTPMNGIVGFSNRLTDEDLTGEERKYYVSIINNCTHQLLRIIDDILEISRLETKQVRINESEICLNKLLLRLFAIFDIKAKENRIPLYLEKGLNDRASTIFTDEVKLSKILNNLLENALKYTDKGYISFGYKKVEGTIEIFVRDTGIGIKKEHQRKIFERFSRIEEAFSTKTSGLGLGLSIAKENAEIIDGKISLNSQVGEGSVFTVTIPYRPVFEDKINDKVPDENNPTLENTSFLILVVEDDEINYLYLEITLLSLMKNIQIFHAKNGKEAIEVCKQRDFDLIFMDIKLPDINGYNVTEEILKIKPGTPVIAQTAYSTREDQNKAMAAGFAEYLSKPIDEELLEEYLFRYSPKKG